MNEKVISPCISICRTDPRTGYCYGCARTNEEKKISADNIIIATGSSTVNIPSIKIDEEKIDDFNQSLVGIFDPEENNFNLHMWSQSDGQEIKNTQPQQNANKVTKEGFCSSITSSS